MGYEQWLEMVKEEFYKDSWVAKRIKHNDIPKEEFERFLASSEVIKDIQMDYRSSMKEWEENKEKFTQKGATLERNARIDARNTAHCLSLMF